MNEMVVSNRMLVVWSEEVTHNHVESKYNGNTSNNSNEEMRHQKNNPNKEKHQVVSSRWSVSSSSSAGYMNDLYERRVQAVDILSQQHQACPNLFWSQV